ncbi:uncharacterized protein BJ171DRAFT_477625 [Polychytrium aggregatum]|uniref:uncharacterized protein n=1 Tax=Polychytrium aggregatum TaxID=110093 RepID=UPI0022FF3F81|nr:uncharacterized protein BJ171DRAFT_477625 [Polychytrium aggregatum]KAI9199315.1 hypothetical protein BJ171DRAFT_477625 [Polychytrium aggregatum]
MCRPGFSLAEPLDPAASPGRCPDDGRNRRPAFLPTAASAVLGRSILATQPSPPAGKAPREPREPRAEALSRPILRLVRPVQSRQDQFDWPSRASDPTHSQTAAAVAGDLSTQHARLQAVLYNLAGGFQCLWLRVGALRLLSPLCISSALAQQSSQLGCARPRPRATLCSALSLRLASPRLAKSAHPCTAQHRVWSGLPWARLLNRHWPLFPTFVVDWIA